MAKCEAQQRKKELGHSKGQKFDKMLQGLEYEEQKMTIAKHEDAKEEEKEVELLDYFANVWRL